VPTESSSGASRSQGSITKTGNTHARRLLVEAAWHHQRDYRTPGVTMRARWDKAPSAARVRGHQGNQRLHQRWEVFRARTKRPLVANVAIARELAGWLVLVPGHPRIDPSAGPRRCPAGTPSMVAARGTNPRISPLTARRQRHAGHPTAPAGQQHNGNPRPRKTAGGDYRCPLDKRPPHIRSASRGALSSHRPRRCWRSISRSRVGRHAIRPKPK
jgi:hypothetical protein